MIQFQSVRKTYASGAAALDDINLDIPGGEIFGVIGRSGAGKSTLLRLINALERPSSGAVLVEGRDVAALDKHALRAQRRRIGMIFQHFNLLSAKTVAQNIAFPLRLAGVPTARINDRVEALLAQVGLDGLGDRYPAQLSGGQKQRVGIARALATEPAILLCDEATSALDPQTTDDILQLLSQLNKTLGLTIVLITHEMEVIRRICHRVAVLDAGRLVETGAVEDVFLHPQHAATRQMLAEAGLDAEKLSEIASGGAPNLRLTFKGAATFEPILGRVARDTGVDYSILSGRIDSIRDQPYGRLIVRLVGGDAQAAKRRLIEAGVEVETLS